MTFTHALSTNNYGPSKFVVSSSAANGTHTTISAALTSSTSGDTIFIRPGTYVENLTLKAGVNLTAYVCDAASTQFSGTSNVVISGTLTATYSGTVSISGIELRTNSAACVTSSGSNLANLNLVGCNINALNNTAITSTNANFALKCFNCVGNVATTGITLFVITTANLPLFENCVFTNFGGTLTPSTIGSSLISRYSSFAFAIATTGSGNVNFYNSIIDTSSTAGVIALTANSGVCYLSTINGGAASAVSVSGSLTLSLCQIISSATNCITGGGTLNYSGLTFTGSRKINTTTQTGGLLAGGLTQAPSAGFIGEQFSDYNSGSTGASGNVVNVATFSLTAGIWDLSGLCVFVCSGSTTILQLSISTTSATITGDLGEETSNFTIAFNVGQVPLVIPKIRATLTSTTTYYLTATATFSTGGVNVFGSMKATRVG